MTQVNLRVYHKPHGRPYAYGSTRNALNRAKRSGKNGVDIDVTANAATRPVWNHWRFPLRQDAWRDPKGQIPHNKPIDHMTDAEIRRVTSRFGEMLFVRTAMGECNKRGLTPCLEMKNDPRHLFYTVEWYEYLKVVADEVGSNPIIMSLPGQNHAGAKKLEAAHAAGFRTMWLWRGPYDPAYDRFLTYVKSRPGHGIYKV